MIATRTSWQYSADKRFGIGELIIAPWHKIFSLCILRSRNYIHHICIANPVRKQHHGCGVPYYPCCFYFCTRAAPNDSHLIQLFIGQDHNLYQSSQGYYRTIKHFTPHHSLIFVGGGAHLLVANQCVCVLCCSNCICHQQQPQPLPEQRQLHSCLPFTRGSFC